MCCSLKQDKPRAESDSRTSRDSVLTDRVSTAPWQAAGQTQGQAAGSAKGATRVQRDKSGPRSSQEAKSGRQSQLGPGLAAG